jgi:hypothetical protein
VSFAQEAIWSFCRTPNPGYTLLVVDRIVGPLDLTVLRDCLNHIVKRHEILRTTFAVAEGRPIQIIHPAESISLPIFEVDPHADLNDRLEFLINAEKSCVADPTQGPLVRFSLLRRDAEEHWLLVICHHLLWDGWSTELLHKELALLYEARHAGREPPLPESEPLQYADYAAWQRKLLHPDGPAYQETIRWWTERFAGKPRPLGPPFRRPVALTGVDPAEGVISWPIQLSLESRLEELRRSEGTTIYNIWLAALVALLAAETGRPEVVVGSYMTHRRQAATQNMFGYFANLVALGFQCDGSMPFRNWLAEVRSVVAGAQLHGEIPQQELRQVLQSQGITLPPIQMVFGAQLDLGRKELRFSGLSFTKPNLTTWPRMPSGFSLDLLQLNGAQICRAAFDAGFYSPSAVRQFIDRLFSFLDAISGEPNRSLSELLVVVESVTSSGETERPQIASGDSWNRYRESSIS